MRKACNVEQPTEQQKGQPKKRKTRSDKGQRQLTERTLYALDRIGEAYAMRSDQIKVLLERYEGHDLAYSTIMELIRKWKEAGWIEFRCVLAAQPGWVWLTRKGLHTVGLNNYNPRPPSWTRLRHIHAVNEVLLLEEWDDWRSERSLRSEYQEKKERHVNPGKSARCFGPLRPLYPYQLSPLLPPSPWRLPSRAKALHLLLLSFGATGHDASFVVGGCGCYARKRSHSACVLLTLKKAPV
jgi:hypothetical protein